MKGNVGTHVPLILLLAVLMSLSILVGCADQHNAIPARIVTVRAPLLDVGSRSTKWQALLVEGIPYFPNGRSEAIPRERKSTAVLGKAASVYRASISRGAIVYRPLRPVGEVADWDPLKVGGFGLTFDTSPRLGTASYLDNVSLFLKGDNGVWIRFQPLLVRIGADDYVLTDNIHSVKGLQRSKLPRFETGFGGDVDGQRREYLDYRDFSLFRDARRGAKDRYYQGKAWPKSEAVQLVPYKQFMAKRPVYDWNTRDLRTYSLTLPIKRGGSGNKSLIRFRVPATWPTAFRNGSPRTNYSASAFVTGPDSNEGPDYFSYFSLQVRRANRPTRIATNGRIVRMAGRAARETRRSNYVETELFTGGLHISASYRYSYPNRSTAEKYEHVYKDFVNSIVVERSRSR